MTEHRAQHCTCPGCDEKVVAALPPEAKAPMQYAEQLQAIALYFGGYQLISCQRLGELLRYFF